MPSDVDYAHHKYNGIVRHHEAGFDSLATARVLIRYGATLHASNTWKQYVEAEEFFTPPESVNEERPKPTGPPLLDIATTIINKASEAGKQMVGTGKIGDRRGSNLSENIPPSSSASTAANSTPKKKVKIKKVKKEKPTTTAMFSSKNPFNLLDDDSSSSEESTDDEPQAGSPLPTKRATPLKVPRSNNPLQYMPPWDSDFWTLYGNKLRVNGTTEGVCKLGDD